MGTAAQVNKPRRHRPPSDITPEHLSNKCCVRVCVCGDLTMKGASFLLFFSVSSFNPFMCSQSGESLSVLSDPNVALSPATCLPEERPEEVLRSDLKLSVCRVLH